MLSVSFMKYVPIFHRFTANLQLFKNFPEIFVWLSDSKLCTDNNYTSISQLNVPRSHQVLLNSLSLAKQLNTHLFTFVYFVSSVV